MIDKGMSARMNMRVSVLAVVCRSVIPDEFLDLFVRNPDTPANAFGFDTAFGDHSSNRFFTQLKALCQCRNAKVLLASCAFAPLFDA